MQWALWFSATERWTRKKKSHFISHSNLEPKFSDSKSEEEKELLVILLIFENMV